MVVVEAAVVTVVDVKEKKVIVEVVAESFITCMTAVVVGLCCPKPRQYCKDPLGPVDRLRECY